VFVGLFIWDTCWVGSAPPGSAIDLLVLIIMENFEGTRRWQY